MSQVEISIYYSPFCPYCSWAQQLLDAKGVEYTLINVSDDNQLREEMELKSGRTSVPQIFIDDYHVGGFDDLSALDNRGGLEPLLKGEVV
ncbi:MAG: glutaredoxin 3 [Gammaproteobacteria bacterium]|nr:glutaredoxin 3 [Gammaproteobacteria bacterium]